MMTCHWVAYQPNGLKTVQSNVVRILVLGGTGFIGSALVARLASDYEKHVRWAEYYKMMQDLALDIPTH